MRMDKLTSKFQLALADAQSLATGLDHQLIEPVHVMIALLDQQGGACRPLLQKAGAAVTENLVKISPSLVEWALASVPGEFNLYRRGSEEIAIVLDGRSCYFGPGSDTFRYLDPRSGERRRIDGFIRPMV